MLHSLLKLIPHGLTGSEKHIADLFSLASQENKLQDIIEESKTTAHLSSSPPCDPYYDGYCRDINDEKADWREVWGYEKGDVH